MRVLLKERSKNKKDEYARKKKSITPLSTFLDKRLNKIFNFFQQSECAKNQNDQDVKFNFFYVHQYITNGGK